MKKALLEVNNLAIEYCTHSETVHAVNGISFSLEPGETIGLVGETGAGKTTTALGIMRLLPTISSRIISGSIKFDGIDMLSLREGDMRAIRGERIAMIFQDPMTSLNPVIKVGDQIKEVLVLHNYDSRTKEGIDKRVDEVLELVGIPSFRKNDYPHQFSGGMKQRVVIAMALACEPELLIADEPTTALDVTIQAQVILLMRELKEKFKTSMIMITHDLGIVAMTCDKVGIMYAGEIVEYGSIEDIFEGKVNHPYTIGLFGSLPNMEEETDRLSPIDGLMPDPTNLPNGCVFSPRCQKCMEICRLQKPDSVSFGTHSITCHLFKNEQMENGGPHD